MLKLIAFIRLIIKGLESLNQFLSGISVKQGFYVYNPNKDKPKRIHHTLKSALEEADRIASLEPQWENFGTKNKIQVLQIVAEVECYGVPF